MSKDETKPEAADPKEYMLPAMIGFAVSTNRPELIITAMIFEKPIPVEEQLGMVLLIKELLQERFDLNQALAKAERQEKELKDRHRKAMMILKGETVRDCGRYRGHLILVQGSD